MTAEELLELTGNAGGKCVLSRSQVDTQIANGMGLKNNDGGLSDFTGYPVIGNQSDMQSSGRSSNYPKNIYDDTCNT